MNWLLGTVIAVVLLIYLTMVVVAYLPYPEVPRSELTEPDDRFAAVDGVLLRYRTHGQRRPERPTLLLVHGFANSLQSFRALVPTLEEDFFVVAVDMPGFGLSDKPVDFDYRNPAQGLRLAGLLDTLGLDKVVVVGHSLGGAVVLHTALNSSRVTGVALLNPGIITTGVPKITQYLFFPLQRLSARQFGNRKFRERFLKSSYLDQTIVTPEVVDAAMLGSRMQGYLAGMSSIMGQYVEGTELPLLEKVNKPTLIIWGEQDRSKPPGEAQQLQQQIPASRLIIVKQAAHYVHEEKPSEVAQALRSASGWLSQAS